MAIVPTVMGLRISWRLHSMLLDRPQGYRRIAPRASRTGERIGKDVTY